MNIGELIKSKRISKGYTLDDLAKIIGVTAATISRWESGKIADMKRSRIQALSDALDIPVYIIMGWPEPKPDGDAKLLELAKQMDPALRALQDKIGKLTIENRISVEIFVDALLAKQAKEKEIKSQSSKEA